MVQKGKFSAGIESFVRVLKRVDFPTFGNPTCDATNKAHGELQAMISYIIVSPIISTINLNHCIKEAVSKKKRINHLKEHSDKHNETNNILMHQ